jgi:LPXTG-site transpeptidase (sortase) family protein
MMRPRQPLDAESIWGTTDEEVLTRFVASVREWRTSGRAQPRFRRDDLDALAELLGSDVAGIERRLISLTGCDRATARRLRRLLLVSLVVPVAVTALTIAPLSKVSGAPGPPSGQEPSGPPATVGVHRPSVSPQPPVPVTEPPKPTTTTPPASTPAPAPAPTRAAVRADAEATVSIRRLGLELPVVDGGQEVIDQGLVAHYWAPGWREPAAPGGHGTYWLAAHHTTHGSPFLALPDVVVGDRIDVRTIDQTFTYTVTSTDVVEDDAGFGPRVRHGSRCLGHPPPDLPGQRPTPSGPRHPDSSRLSPPLRL